MYKQYIKFLPLMLLFSLSAAQMPRKENSKVTNKEYQKFGNDVINSPFTNFFLNTFSLFSRVYFVYYLFPASLLVSLLLLELLIYIKFFIVEKNTFNKFCVTSISNGNTAYMNTLPSNITIFTERT
jgi:hypothetical protein